MVATSVIEQYNLHRYREAVVLVVCLIMFTLGLSCVTQVRHSFNDNFDSKKLPGSFYFGHL